MGLKSLADEIDALGAKVVTGHLDVTDPDETAQRVSEFAEAAGDRLDVMINNAGIMKTGPFEEIAVSAHLKEIDINTKGVVNGLHAAFPYLKDTPNSVVVNLASASAIYGQPELANYSATKFFVRGITEALDIEWGSYGIRVIAVWPLYVKTAMTHNIKTGTTESLGIRLTAQDVADAILRRGRAVLSASHDPPGALSRRRTDQGVGGRRPVHTRLAAAAGQQAPGGHVGRTVCGGTPACRAPVSGGGSRGSPAAAIRIRRPARSTRPSARDRDNWIHRYTVSTKPITGSTMLLKTPRPRSPSSMK